MTEPSNSPLRIPSTDGVRVALHDLGGSGPLLLVAHATGFHGPAYTPLVRRLSGLRAWAPDLRGHGDATAEGALRFTWEGFTEDLIAAATHLDGELLGFGHSMGGALLLLAELKRPGLFRALYCYEPIVFPAAILRARPSNPLAESARRRRSSFPSCGAAYDHYTSKPPLGGLHPEALRAYVEHGFAAAEDGTVHLKCSGEHEAQVFEMTTSDGALERLAGVEVPVTIARGHLGPRQTAARLAPEIARHLPRGRQEVFEELGHLGPLEDPDRIARAVRAAFLQGGSSPLPSPDYS